MRKTNKKSILLFVGVAALIVALTVTLNPAANTPSPDPNTVSLHYSLHTLITVTRYGKIVFQEYHSGYVTKLGMNYTLAKLSGDVTDYNVTQMTIYCYWVSIGNMGTLTTDSTCLPGEWNRTLSVAHDGTYNHCNFTAVFHPGTGPYTADCLGINFEDTIGNNALFGYDTFTEITGIDNTFTITLEIQLGIA